MIRLTEDQATQLELAGDLPVEVIDPRSSRKFYLIQESELRRIRDVLNDDHEQRVLAETAWQGLSRLLKDEPW